MTIRNRSYVHVGCIIYNICIINTLRICDFIQPKKKNKNKKAINELRMAHYVVVYWS